MRLPAAAPSLVALLLLLLPALPAAAASLAGGGGTAEVRATTMDPAETGGIKVYAEPGTEYIDLTLHDTALRPALQTIARFAGVSLVIQDGVKGSISVSLRDVYYEKALQMVALSGGYDLNRIGDRLYMVGDAKIISTAAGASGYRTFVARHQNAAGMAGRITALFGKRLDFGTATIFGEDRVLVSGSSRGLLDEVGALLADLDVPSPNVKSSFSLLRIVPGPAGKAVATAIASFDVVGTSGWKNKIANRHEYSLGKSPDGGERRGEVTTELTMLAVDSGEGRLSVVVEGKFVVEEMSGPKGERAGTRLSQEVDARLVVREGEPRDVAVYREASGEELVLRMTSAVEPVR